ncbi:uncharacterized protein LOC112462889, partial [Temnothorax curvispinosus]|uniref:Uncharacterized protein LOC112462889 n=1 Tax=Temnothorax curvispinosus TaxID=300111 RepID=A0A6J1QQH4_9HYME
MSHLYKVWTADRKKKISLILRESDNMLSELIEKSSTKLDIAGSVLVMEKDGTIVDDNEVVKFCFGEIFMLLQPEESWSAQNETELNTTLSDTTSLTSSSFKEGTLFSYSSSSQSTASSPTFETCNNKIQLSNNIWKNYQIPWDKLEMSVIKELENGSRSKYAMTAVVNRIVSEMRNIQEFIPAKAFKIIAEQIVSKYPKTFKDMDEDGKCFGDGSYTLFAKLRDRNNYLNRPHMKRSLSHTLTIPLKKQKKVMSAKAGCSNWQPEKFLDTETEETVEDKTKFLREIVNDDSSKRDPKIQQKIISNLEATYPAQRLYLNNVHDVPTIIDIKNTWPILLQKKYMFWHYEKLMGCSIHILKEEMLKKQHKIEIYGHKKYKDITNSNDPTEMKVMKIIFKHFKEDFEELFKTYSEGTTMEHIEAPVMTPCIIII